MCNIYLCIHSACFILAVMLMFSTTHSVSSYSVQVETVTLSDGGTGSHSTPLIKHQCAYST